MRALPLAAVLAGLAGCVVPEPYPMAPRAPAAAPALTQDQAVQAAFKAAAERRLEVDRVQHAHLDLSGRWHVDLVGPRDRAQVVLDGRDGRFLQGRFKSGDGSAGPGGSGSAPSAPPPPAAAPQSPPSW